MRYVALASTLVFGAAPRFVPAAKADFPVNDGGLFWTMAADIGSAGFALPSYSSYNGGTIPFTYPPLGLYAIAVADKLGLDPLTALRFIPALTTAATIPLMFLLSRRILGSGPKAIVATATFAFTTGSYQWLVMGGGVTRALGFLMALLALQFAVQMYQTRRWSSVVFCGVALGATGLSHPQAAAFAVMSVSLLLPFSADNLATASRRLLVAGVIAASVVSPWIVLVLMNHGLAPLLNAMGSGGPVLRGLVSLASSRTSGGYLEVIGVATGLGLVVCALRRYWLPVAWAVAIALIDSRAGQPYLSIPASLAVAFLIGDISRIIHRSIRDEPRLIWTRRLPATLTVVLIAAAFFDSLASQSVPGSPLRTLPHETRDAMAWVRDETARSSRFVVLSGWYWALDAESEWFPALADRQSVATVQGTEWLATHKRMVERAAELPICVVADDRACIEDWFSTAGAVDYLFLVDTPSREIAGFTCCLQLEKQVSGIYATEVVHREGDVVVVRLTPRS